MKPARLLPVIALALALAGCGTPEIAAPPTPRPAVPSASNPSPCALPAVSPSSAAPDVTAAPEPTAAPALTVAPAELPAAPASTESLDPPAPTDIPYELIEATSVARATAFPVPTAEPAAVQVGQTASATTQRAGLSLTLRLPKDAYLAGEGGPAQVTLRNDGTERFFITGDGQNLAWLTLLDEQGDEPDPWPCTPVSMPGMPYLDELAPGEVVSANVRFQVPPAEQVAGHAYVLWAAVRFSRAMPGDHGADNIWLQLETGPIPLQLTAPDATQQLRAALQADRDGWRLRVTDASGKAPNGPLWGEMEAATLNSFTRQTLRERTDGAWSGVWEDHMRRGNPQIAARAWVAAPGYVTAAVTQTVPGAGDASRMFGAAPPVRQTFSTLAEAQAALGVTPFQPGELPPGAALEAVRTESRTDPGGVAQISQIYRLSDGAALALKQMVVASPWGEARYAAEARPVSVNEGTGYAIQRFGWWMLDWQIGDAGFELRAPTAALTLDDLRAVAASVKAARS